MRYKSEETAFNARTMGGVMFNAKRKGEWVENACSKCKKGMMKKIYDFQSKHRPGRVICSTCDKKQRKKDLKEL